MTTAIENLNNRIQNTLGKNYTAKKTDKGLVCTCKGFKMANSMVMSLVIEKSNPSEKAIIAKEFLSARF